MSWGGPGILKSSSGMDAISNRWESIITYLCLGTRSLLGTETFKFKNFEIWLPATYNNGRAYSQILA